MNEELKIFITAQIEGLKEELRKGQKEVQDFAKSGDSGFKKFGEAAKKAGSVVASGLKVAGAAIGAAAGALLALGPATEEYRKGQAKLATAFETAGASAGQAKETYNGLYRVLGDSDVAVEAANHLAQMTTNQEELAQWTDICQGVYATFGDSLPIEGLTEAANETAKVGTVTGSLADALNWAGISEDAFNEKLAACNTEAEREKLIRETLNGVYDEASKNYEKNAASILKENEAQAKLTAAMSQLGAVAVPIMTTLKTIAADLLTTIAPFVELIGEGLLGALEGNADAANLFAEGLTGILTTATEMVTNMLPTIIEMIVALVPTLLEALAEQLPTILEALLTGINLIIEGLATMLPSIVNAIMEILPQLINQLIASIPTLLQAAITLLMAIVQAIPTIVVALIDALPSIIQTIITALIESLPILLDAAIQLLMAIVEAIPTIIDALIENLPTIIDTIITGVLDALPLLLDAAITLFLAIVEAIPDFLPELILALPRIIVTITTTLLRKLPDIIAAAFDLFMGVVKAIPKMIVELVKKIPEIITKIVEGLKNGISKVKDVGKDIIKGLWNGIKDMGSWIGNKIKGFGKDVLGGIKSFFGIKSPSRVMRDQVGKFLAEGIGIGFEDEMKSVNRDIEKSLQPITSARSFDIDGAFNGTANLNPILGSLAPLTSDNQWMSQLATTFSRSGDTPIILQVDGKTFAQTTINTMNELTRQTGSLQLNIV